MGRAVPYTATVNGQARRCVIGLASAVALLLSLFHTPSLAATPSACVLKWAAIDTPSSYPERNDIRVASEINAMAVSPDGMTIYALDIPNAKTAPLLNAGIWKSQDGGISWSPRPTQWLLQVSPAPVFPVADIAIAPDNPDLAAVVCMDAAGTHRRQVYYTVDGGTNWYYSGAIPWLYGAGEQVGDIAISTGYSWRGDTVHDIIVGSRNPTDGLGRGEVYILRYPGIAGWQAQGFTNGDILVLLSSPAYVGDSTLAVMSCTAQTTYINLGYRDIDANSCSWNEYPGWPVELCTPDQSGGSGSGQNRIITGDLALPADFEGTTAARRIIFASYDSNGLAVGTSQPLDDVYRLNDSLVTRLKVPGYGTRARICSIAYSGTTLAGKLLAGAVPANSITAEAVVWFTSSPLATCTNWLKPLKAPTGGRYTAGCANSIVAWTSDGSTALCATGSGSRDTPLQWANPTGPSWGGRALDESAFSLSLDDGTSWNQLGLIDTQINHLGYVAVAPDGKTVYLSSVNDMGLDSAWRSSTPLTGDAWQRVLCIDCSSPLLELAPDIRTGSQLFLGNGGTDRVLQSRDSGQTWLDCFPAAYLQDMAARDSNTLFVLQSNGLIRRGTYSTKGWLWGGFTDSCLTLAHTIDVQKTNVIVGAGTGQRRPVSYSSDDGDTWTVISEQALSFGNKHVALDDGFKDNHLIYLGDDAGGLYRWAIGSSDRWDDMVPSSNSYYGVCSVGRGTLYAAYNPISTRGVDRTLYSRAGIPKNGVSWDPLTVGLSDGVLFKIEPVAMVCASDAIWAIDARNYDPMVGIGRLWAFRDTLTERSPWLIAPRAGSYVQCDPVTGRNSQVDLKWEQLSLADAYEIEVAKDSWFDLVVENASPSTSPFFVPDDLLYPAWYIRDGVLPEAGNSYYWHVRVRRAVTGQVIRSHWAPGTAFYVRPGFPVTAQSYPGIQALSPSPQSTSVPVYAAAFSWTPLQGVTSYRFMLATDPAMRNPVVDEKVQGNAYRYRLRLDYAQSYFWQVTPLEPVAGEPGPVFSFTTVERAAPAGIPGQIPDNTANGLLITLILVILFGLSLQVVIYRRR